MWLVLFGLCVMIGGCEAPPPAGGGAVPSNPDPPEDTGETVPDRPTADTGPLTDWYADADLDGFGDMASTWSSVRQPAWGYVAQGGTATTTTHG
ncbi:MAG: hypothetical protein KTR31_17425 [Myxococcales bacterium]|nr:hypothetical protein [Myxococcales bacterium]